MCVVPWAGEEIDRSLKGLGKAWNMEWSFCKLAERCLPFFCVWAFVILIFSVINFDSPFVNYIGENDSQQNCLTEFNYERQVFSLTLKIVYF